MLQLLKNIIKGFMQNPGKYILTLFTVGAGVTVLILALSISSFLQREISDKLVENGILMTLANGEYSETGEFEREMPPQFNEEIPDILAMEIEGFVNAAPVTPTFYDSLNVNNKTYQIRNLVGSNENYKDVMDLTILEGSFFNADDVNKGNKKAVISESLAILLFGSAKEAVGQSIKPPGMQMERPGGRNSRFYQPVYTITGVYEDPDELMRSNYNIADMVIPYTSALPVGGNAERMKSMMLNTYIARINDTTPEQAESQIRSILMRELGDDIQLVIWEGSSSESSENLDESRNTVNIFNIVVNLLGFVLLITGSIGILSIMLIEALGRSRDIALERALGASKQRIIKEFFLRALVLSGLSALLGIIAAVIFSTPLKAQLIPVLSEFNLSEAGSILSSGPILIGVLSALISGGVFGIVPVFSVLKAGISDTLREG